MKAGDLVRHIYPKVEDLPRTVYDHPGVVTEVRTWQDPGKSKNCGIVTIVMWSDGTVEPFYDEEMDFLEIVSEGC